MELTTMILRGRAGTDVTVSTDDENEVAFGRFRMVVPRSRRKDNGQWEDLDGHWYTVKAWGRLAKNLRASIRRGDPIVVIGRPAPNAWISQEGEICSNIAVHAITVGHDNMFGISTFVKPAARPALAESDLETAPIEPTMVEEDKTESLEDASDREEESPPVDF